MVSTPRLRQSPASLVGLAARGVTRRPLWSIAVRRQTQNARERFRTCVVMSASQSFDSYGCLINARRRRVDGITAGRPVRIVAMATSRMPGDPRTAPAPDRPCRLIAGLTRARLTRSKPGGHGDQRKRSRRQPVGPAIPPPQPGYRAGRPPACKVAPGWQVKVAVTRSPPSRSGSRAGPARRPRSLTCRAAPVAARDTGRAQLSAFIADRRSVSTVASQPVSGDGSRDGRAASCTGRPRPRRPVVTTTATALSGSPTERPAPVAG